MYYDKELEKLEKEQRLLALANDQWNTNREIPIDEDYTNFIKQPTIAGYHWKQSETLANLAIKLEAHIEIINRNSVKAHIRGARGAWATHTRNPMGCFMCDDLNIINYIYTAIIKPLSIKYPTLTPQDIVKNPTS